MDLTVLTFNILFGGGEPARMDAIAALLGRLAPDLAVLQECMDWAPDDPRLAAVAAALGVPFEPAHVVLGRARPRGSGSRYHVALLSRHPVLAHRAHADPARIGHVILESRIQVGPTPLTCFATHFDSHGEDQRVAEARVLGELAPPARLAREPALLLGDLNALSPRDPYPADLAARLARAGVDKYGHPPRFETIGLLEAGGWIDALHAAGPPGAWVTAPRDRGGVRIDYRSDYVFVSPVLAPHLTGVEIVPLDAAESDHYPVLARFRLPG